MAGREVRGQPVADHLPGLVGQAEPLHAGLGAQRTGDLGMYSLDPLDRRSHRGECSTRVTSLELRLTGV
ncbi:MAG: hypothetical protein A3G97_15105 [Candidatus Rokubacteria bacterium RIFCSPLOWO2_12_FULL_69_21]|nr:MAG: hypothetical protein A3G97_15105 [Candidatus Rokubacteria bacterium RIFCSPLOWO2_12_FULL_69_21]